MSQQQLQSQQQSPLAPSAQSPAGATGASGSLESLRAMSYSAGAGALVPGAETSASPGPSQTQTDPLAIRSDALGGHPVFSSILAGSAMLFPGHKDRTVVSMLQSVLHLLQHDCGPVDGLWGAKTTAGVKAFQSGAGLAADGVVGPLTTRALDDASAGQGRGEGPSGVLIGPDGNPVNSKLGYNADERMEFDDKGDYKGTNVYDLDNEKQGLKDTDRLPFSPFFLTWDHEAILKRWSQIDTTSSTLTDKTRCQAQVALAPRVVEGPNAVASYAQHVREKLKYSMVWLMMTVRIRDPQGKGPELATLQSLPGRLDTSIARLSDVAARPGATFEDLVWIAEATRWAIAGDTTVQPNVDNAVEAHGLGVEAGSFTKLGTVIRSRAALEAAIRALAPSESYSVGVDTSDRGENDVSTANHSITIGRDPSGKTYLYDPFPKAGDQWQAIDFSDEARFWPYFEKTSSRNPKPFKEVVLDSKANASKQTAPGAAPNPWGTLPDGPALPWPTTDFDPFDMLGS